MPAAQAAESSFWTVLDATYSEDSLDVSAETKDTRATEFKPDGTMVYVVGRGTSNVAAYALATPWNLATGTFVGMYHLGNEVGSRAQGAFAHGLFFRKADGRKMYVWNRTEAFAYDLSTPWDITTANPTGYLDFTGIVQRGHDIDFKPDGTRLYVDDRDAGKVFQFGLVTPWAIESSVLEFALDISDRQKAVRGIQLSADGHRLFVMDTGHRSVLEYHLPVEWDLAGATYHARLDVGDRFKNPRGLTWRPDGGAFFVTETAGGRIRAYNARPGVRHCILPAMSECLLKGPMP